MRWRLGICINRRWGFYIDPPHRWTCNLFPLKMRKAESSNPKDKDTPSFEGPRHRPHWLAAFTCLVFGVLSAVALLDFSPEQSIWHTTSPTSVNLVGVVGAESSWGSYYLIGASTWLIPVFLFWMTYIYLRSARSLTGTRIFAMACCIISLSPLLAMQSMFFSDRDVFTMGPGGLIGGIIYKDVLRDSIGVFGSALILGTIYFVGMLFIFTRDIAAEIARLMNNFVEWRHKRAALKAARLDERRQRREAQAAQAKEATVAAAAAAIPPAGSSKRMVVPKTQDPLTDTPKTVSISPVKPLPELV